MAGASAVRPELYRRLEIEKGVTAVIGSGGKTSLLLRLCRELPGTVILCTSTRIYPMEGLPLVTEAMGTLPFEKLCTGTPAEHRKLSAPVQPFEELVRLADYVIVEADGSRGLPLKAHLDHEPVIPACARQTIQVVGLWGLGKPVLAAAHRPARYAALCGTSVEQPVTPEMAARVIQAEGLCHRVLLNGSSGPEAERLAALLHVPCDIVSLL